MKDRDGVDDLLLQEPWELSLVLEKIIDYNDPNVEILRRNTSTSNLSKQKGKIWQKENESLKNIIRYYNYKLNLL